MKFRYRILLPLWGKDYVTRFCEVALPTQLASGNLPSLPRERTSFHFFTPSVDIPQIKASPAFRTLSALVPTHFEPIDDLYLRHPYYAMKVCHNRGLTLGRKEDCAYLFVLPDMVWSDGTFARMHQLLESGKRAVVLPATRMTAETVVPEMRRAINPADASLSVAGRRMVSLILEHMHPAFREYLWTPQGTRGPGYWQFLVGSTGMLIRALHLHPLVVRPVHRDERIVTTFDGPYISRSCPDPSTVHVITDSDEMCAAEISPAKYLEGFYSKKPLGVEDHVRFLQHNTDEHHRRYLNYQIRLHADEFSDDWKRVEQLSDDIVGEVLNQVRAMPEIGPNGDTGPETPRRVSIIPSLTRPLRKLLQRDLKRVKYGPIRPAVFFHENGFAYGVNLKALGINLASDADLFTPESTDRIPSQLVLLEDGRPLGPAHSAHTQIRHKGEGRYSHWNDDLIFSASDNSDPGTNGKRYEIVVPVNLSFWARRLRWMTLRVFQKAKAWTRRRG